MATKTIRIGSAENIIQYDSGDYDSGIECDAPIKADTPVDPTDVIRLEDLTGRLLNPTSVVNIANPTELNSIAGVLGAMILAYQIVGAGGLNVVTLYVYDASGPAVNSPYIVDADGAGSERWIAVAGRYAVQSLSLLGNIILTGNITINGDLEFGIAGKGLSFGSCSGYHINWTQAAVQNTWYNVSDVDFIDGQLNQISHDGSGKLTVANTGKYLCNLSLDWEVDGANKHIEVGFEVDNSGSAETEGIVCNETKFANEESIASTTAILDLSAGDTLEICVRTTEIGNPTITVDCVSLNCIQIGG